MTPLPTPGKTTFKKPALLGLKKLKNTVPWTYVIIDLNDNEIIGTLYEIELQKTNQQEFRIEKTIQKKR